MKSIGKKGKEWERVRKRLKKEFDRAGICYCEAKFPGCMMGIGLGFAHVLKRRHLGKVGSEEREINISQCALLCNVCHEKLELMGEDIGGQEVLRLIGIREAKCS